MRVLSVNVGQPQLNPWKTMKLTGIDKRPVEGPVMVTRPRAKGMGMVGLAGDRVYDVREHGGPDRAVYAYAREDLDFWAVQLARTLPNGVFGENLTTEDADANGAWIKRFTLAAMPGAYFRVVEPGEIQAGDPIEIVHRPDHDVTVALSFRALTMEPDLLPRLLVADALPEELKDLARRRTA
jgi:MOSC domain-containing protein YiiM